MGMSHIGRKLPLNQVWHLNFKSINLDLRDFANTYNPDRVQLGILSALPNHESSINRLVVGWVANHVSVRGNLGLVLLVFSLLRLLVSEEFTLRAQLD